MRDLLRRLKPLKPVLKILLLVAILVFLGRHFWHDLQELTADVWLRWLHRPGALAAAALLYLLGIGFSGVYWRSLLKRFGPAPSLVSAERAYYLGHLGKYLPGKAWALFLRASLVRDAGVGPALATMTAFYEVLVTMSSAVLLAAVLFAALAPATRQGLDFAYLKHIVWDQAEQAAVVDRNTSVALSVFLLLVVSMPVLPPVFNRLVHHLSLPFRDKETPAPAIPWPAYFEGLAVTGWGWVLQGASLAVVLFAAAETPLRDPALFFGRVLAIMGVSYVAGFVSMVSGGLGVREFFLMLFLVPELEKQLNLPHEAAHGTAFQAVIVLRVVWTAAELLISLVVYWMPVSKRESLPA